MFSLKSYSSLATLVESEHVYNLTNFNTETYHVLAVLNILLRSNANEPLEVRSKVALTDKSSFNSYTLERMLFSEQPFCLQNSQLNLVSVRRHSKGFAKRSIEMEWTQVRNLR